MALKTSERGKEFISTFEGVVLKAYPDPGTGKAPWTIGAGHTAAAGKPVVTKGMTITHAQAMEILTRDLASFEAWVLKLVKVPLTQAQFDALVSFVFNVGPGNFQKSSVLRLLNKNDQLGAGASFAAWNKAAGKVMSGLVRRRAAERTLFETGHYGVAIAAGDDVATGVVMARNSSHPEGVRALQADLISLGLLPVGSDDGDFGVETEKAVRLFQDKHGLAVDGRVGPATRSAMAAALTKAAKPIAVAMFPLRSQPIDLPLAA